jgi:hypothetical protein
MKENDTAEENISSLPTKKHGRPLMLGFCVDDCG